jgi:carbon-monoxide dehydrogenase medium subunit
MIPATFEYHAPRSIQEATGLLARLGEDAKILSGGQSLIPLMKLRVASPNVLSISMGCPGSTRSPNSMDSFGSGACAASRTSKGRR